MHTTDQTAKLNAKLSEIKTKYVTMQDHMELRKIVGAKPFESIDRVMRRYAVRLVG